MLLQDEVRIAVLGLFSLSFLCRQQRQQEPRYERTPRRWLGLRPGKLILAEEQEELCQHQYALHGMPLSEVWYTPDSSSNSSSSDVARWSHDLDTLTKGA